MSLGPTRQDAETQMMWSYIGVALTVLDVASLAGGGRLLRLLGKGAAGLARGIGTRTIEGLFWAKRVLGLPTDIVANLTLSGVGKLQSLSAEIIEGLASLSDTLKRIVLGCCSPCRVNLDEIRSFVTDRTRKASASKAPLTSINDIVAALPPKSQFNRDAIKEYLKSHPSAVEFIRRSRISADDLSGLTILGIVKKGTLSEEGAQRTFSKYLTSLVPAKLGPNKLKELISISKFAEMKESGSAATALKGAMFENYVLLYSSHFRNLSLGRIQYTRSLIKTLTATERTSDAWVSKFGELWDFKNISGTVDKDQVHDYMKILAYERSKKPPEVTSINYLFSTKEAAQRNAFLKQNRDFRVWYFGANGQRVRL